MARISLSIFVDDIRGKVNGSVIQASNGTLIMRTRVSPRNPSSMLQQNRRAAYAAIASAFAALSPSDRDSWYAPVTGYPVGFERFVAVNSRVAILGVPLITEFTATELLPELFFNVLFVTPTYYEVIVPFGTDPIPPDNYYFIYASTFYSGGRLTISDKLLYIVDIAPPGEIMQTGYSITGPMIAKYGTSTPGQRVAFGCIHLDVSTGGLSAFEKVIGTVS